jgi:hypothetical protein
MRDVINPILIDIYRRLEAIESAYVVVPLEELEFEVGAVVAPTSPPWVASSGGVRVSCPFTPSGVFVLKLERIQPSGQFINSSASDVKWHYGTGLGAGDGVLHIDYVTGLTTGRWRMKLGVTRA